MLHQACLGPVMINMLLNADMPQTCKTALPFDQGLDIGPLCCSHIALIPVLIFSKISSVLQHVCIAWQRIICSSQTMLGETH